MKQIKKKLMIAILAITAIAPINIQAQADNRPYIMQNSTCEEKVTPDELYVSITINEKDNKGKQSVEELQTLMIKTLQNIGIDIEKSLTLNYMGSEITYTTFRRNITPRTSATYMLKLGSADTMQKVISQLEVHNITNIQLVRTNYSKEDEIYKQLGAKAMIKAKEEAANLAEAIGQSIGAAQSINSNKYSSGSAQPRFYKARNTMAIENAALDASDEPQVEIGKITYTVNVNVKFLLNDK